MLSTTQPPLLYRWRQLYGSLFQPLLARLGYLCAGRAIAQKANGQIGALVRITNRFIAVFCEHF